jgi:hypothetical protein
MSAPWEIAANDLAREGREAGVDLRDVVGALIDEWQWLEGQDNEPQDTGEGQP